MAGKLEGPVQNSRRCGATVPAIPRIMFDLAACGAMRHEYGGISQDYILVLALL
jgi:hypothetical protein